MTKEEALKEVRTLVNQLDGLAEQITDYLAESGDDDADVELHEQMEELKNTITEYQEAKGYI